VPADDKVKPARERILDAAAAVMREKGLTNTTTKAIAAAAGYSEALLYKHFADKQELFLSVLKERVPQVHLYSPGGGELADNLTGIVEQLMGFFVQTFPIAASIFGSPELLAEHRKAITGRGYGPAGPVYSVQAYLDVEQRAGRISAASDTTSAARLLVGAAFHQGFLAAFDGFRTVSDAHAIAAGIVATVLPALAETQ
jgi:AcrR family transcriptional regulator